MPPVCWLTRFQLPLPVWTSATPAGNPVAVAVSDAAGVRVSTDATGIAVSGSLYCTDCDDAKLVEKLGAVRSTLTTGDVIDLGLPATSVTLKVLLKVAPSPNVKLPELGDAKPDPPALSLAV